MPTVKKVSEYEITVGKKTYMVDDDTVILVNGKKSSLSTLKRGMRVMVIGKTIARGRTTEDSLFEASRITAKTKK